MSNGRHNRPNFGAATGTGKTFGCIFFAFLHHGKELPVILLRLVFPAKIFFAVTYESRKIRLAFVA